MGWREGAGGLGRDTDSWVRESGLNINHWNNCRLFHGERVFEEDVSLYCYELDCR